VLRGRRAYSSPSRTEKLSAALAGVQHLRGGRLLLQDDGSEVTAKVLRLWMKSAQRLAGLKVTGNFHVLRHTFCSHLAMRGLRPRSSRSWPVTRSSRRRCRYMHLAKGHKEQAISLLDQRPANAEPSSRGGGVEAQS